MLFYIYLLLIAVGLIQILGFIYRLVSMKSKPGNYRNKLKYYGISVFIYLILLLVASLLEMSAYIKWSETFIIIYIIIIPILLAVYYWEAIYKKRKDRSKIDS